MVGEYARITPAGQILIDTAAWLADRSGGLRADLTEQFRRWANGRLDLAGTPPGSPHPDTGPATAVRAATAAVAGSWPGLARAWCEHAGHQESGPGLVVHERTRLDTGVWVLPAVTAPGGDRIAVIATGQHPPAVHTDTTADPWAWCDADTVTITCPTPGHWWTWKSGRELLTSTGRPATLTGVFGPNLDAPFSSCPDCAAYQLGHGRDRCGCDGVPWIVCPACGQRCRLTPPHP